MSDILLEAEWLGDRDTVQDQNDSIEQDLAFQEFCEQSRLESIRLQEETGYSDRCELELAIANGFDCFAGITPAEYLASLPGQLVTA